MMRDTPIGLTEQLASLKWTALGDYIEELLELADDGVTYRMELQQEEERRDHWQAEANLLREELDHLQERYDEVARERDALEDKLDAASE